jgi:hypothetical protein
MTFTLSNATPKDVPSIVDCDRLAFARPDIQAVIPHTEPVRKWLVKSFLTCIQDKDQNGNILILTKDVVPGDLDCKREVVAFARYLKILGGPLKHWKKRWVVDLPEGMSEEVFGGMFLEPLDRQQFLAVGERPHICTTAPYSSLVLVEEGMN